MDVLEYWHPNMSWTGFRRGAVSERMWGYFCQLVQLCHAHGHWQKVTQDIRLTPSRPSVYGPESKYQRNKRRNEWKGEINRAEGHMHRAAYLAAERIAGMSHLLTNDDEGKRLEYVLGAAHSGAASAEPYASTVQGGSVQRV